MEKRTGKRFVAAAGFFAAFVLWTAAVCRIDVKPIGPQGSAVGFSEINRFVHSMTGVHMSLYTITDWLVLVPILLAAGFTVLGLVQWIRRKHLLRVDYSLFVLGGFYLAVMVVYVFFEMYAVNYRPVLIDGVLEASYPSSTTMLVLCVMPTAMMQLQERIRSRILRRCICLVMAAFTVFMVVGRLVSGVHWFTDIVGGVLVSGGLVMLYSSLCGLKKE